MTPPPLPGDVFKHGQQQQHFGRLHPCRSKVNYWIAQGTTDGRINSAEEAQNVMRFHLKRVPFVSTCWTTAPFFDRSVPNWRKAAHSRLSRDTSTGGVLVLGVVVASAARTPEMSQCWFPVLVLLPCCSLYPHHCTGQWHVREQYTACHQQESCAATVMMLCSRIMHQLSRPYDLPMPSCTSSLESCRSFGVG